MQAKFINSHSNKDREKTCGTKGSHSPEDEMEKGTSIPPEMNHEYGPELHKVWVPRPIEVATSEDNSDYTDRIMTALR